MHIQAGVELYTSIRKIILSVDKMVESGFSLFLLTFNKPKTDSKANRAIIDQLIPILKDSVDATANVGRNKKLI